MYNLRSCIPSHFSPMYYVALSDVFQAIRSLTGKSISAYCFEANSVISTIPFLGPERLGGMGNKSLKAHTEADATGRKYEEVLDEVSFFVLMPLH